MSDQTQPTALIKLPRPPKAFTKEQADAYKRIGRALVDARLVGASDMLMVEAAARVLASIQKLYADASASPATIAALERLHKEQLVQLGLTPAARKNTPTLATPEPEDEFADY